MIKNQITSKRTDLDFAIRSIRSKLPGITVIESRLTYASPPNVLIGGPVPFSPGFPLKACGNDRLRKER